MKTMMRRSLGERLFDAGNLACLAAFAFAAVYPFLYVLTLSFSTARAAAESGLKLFPTEWSLTSYAFVLNNPEILVGYGNTLFRTVTGTLGVLFFTALTAYPLARKDLPGRSAILLFILVTMLFSGGLVATYVLYRGLGLLDSRLVYVLPGLISAFNVIILKNFFRSVPESLAESARLDGASEWRILMTIYLPLSKPVLATVGLWTAVAHWNAWFDALVFVNSEEKQVLSLFLQRIVIAQNTELVEKGLVNPDLLQFTSETIKAATIVVTILPILLVYPFLQRYFVKGILLGGVKE